MIFKETRVLAVSVYMYYPPSLPPSHHPVGCASRETAAELRHICVGIGTIVDEKCLFKIVDFTTSNCV